MRRVIAITMVALAAVAIAPIARAQQADAQTKQAVEILAARWQEAVNKGDGKTLSSLFTPDSFAIDVYGKHSGGPATEETQKLFDMGINVTNKVDDVRSLASGQVLLASGTFSVSYSKNPTMKPGDTVMGNWMRVLVKEGPDWKVLAQGTTRQVALPQPTASGSSTSK